MKPEPIPTALLALAEPSKHELLELLRSRVHGAMLEEIAANDDGEEVADHLAAIKAQMHLDAALGRLEWWPIEVLQLQTYIDPEDSLDPAREHVKSMLACAILLRNAGCLRPAVSNDEFFLGVSAQAVCQLVRSILADQQTPSITVAGMALLLWLYESQPFPELQPLAAFGCFVLAANLNFGDAADCEVQAACDWMNAVEMRCRSILERHVRSEHWLTGLNIYAEDKMQRARWFAAARAAFSRATGRSDETWAKLQWIFGRI